MKKAVFLYVPVWHEGYQVFFEQAGGAEKIFVPSAALLKKFDYVRKDLRALKPERSADLLKKLFKIPVEIVDEKQLLAATQDYQLIVADDDISRTLLEGRDGIEFRPVFLRWDRDNVDFEVEPNVDSIELVGKKAEAMILAHREALKSSDIWRKVGAVLTDENDEVIVSAYNRGLPNDYSTWQLGDPRNQFKKGKNIDSSSFVHAEASLIAEAAKRGISTNGMTLFVKVFPCPSCAKLIAGSGIKEVYFSSGYSTLESLEIMLAANVKALKGALQTLPAENPDSLRKYPS